MSPEKVSRTFIGSVVCVDLVGYSTKSTSQQGSIKRMFNGLLAQALAGIPAEDRIILDTGDGAAISFLGDPESSLSVGLELRRVMCERAAELGATGEGPDQGPVRIGINLGPVKLAMDLNGYPKIIGDGINVAERIMSFAKPGQVVASRSFHDMVSRLSDGNAALFRYEGVRTDKNVRDHEIYVVETVPPAKPPSSTIPPAAAAASTPSPAPSGLVAFLQDRFKVGFAAVLLVAVIAAEGLLLATRSPAGPSKLASAPSTAPAPTAIVPEPAPKVVPSAPAPVAPKAVETKPVEVKPAVAKPEPAPVPRPEVKPSPAPREPEKAPAAKAPPPEPEKPAATKPAPPKPAPVEPPKAAPPKAAVVEPPKAAPPKATVIDPPKTAARKPEEPTRFAAPLPVAPVPEPIREEPPRPSAPAPTATVTLVSRARVEFPVEAAAKRIDAGTVRARVTINAAGGVSNVQILEARPRRYFDSEATRALKLFKFNPGLEGRTYEVEIEFQR